MAVCHDKCELMFPNLGPKIARSNLVFIYFLRSGRFRGTAAAAVCCKINLNTI